MKKLIHLFTLWGLVSGLGCGFIGEQFPNYGVKIHSYVDLFKVSLSINGSKVGSSPNIYGTNYAMGSFCTIECISVPLQDPSVLQWKTRDGQKHERAFNIVRELPDEWKASRDTIVFTFLSNENIKVSFLIQKGRPGQWYELPPKSESQ